MEKLSSQNESLSLDQILSLTDNQINKLSYQEVESAQFLLKKNNLMSIKAENPIGLDYHPMYAKLVARRGRIEYPDSK